jgi:Antibiotic biosynthesis monooxygenase
VSNWLHLLVSALLLGLHAEQQPGSATPTDTRFYAVAYVEAMASSSPKAIALLKQYREASTTHDGFMSIELFEQIGRPGQGNVRFDVVQHTMRANHFTVVEVWRDQKALDAHVTAPHTRQYRDTLQPMTGSPLDERVYKSVD